ncbi:zinc-dependent metalloprotease [Psychroserpens algicola]|uniref:zinc-dependent metalloprotease n=1 Tax=Psychroserpens algicola TaxID=1719034 RepID=UPI001953D00B|nr:zinc-dependent metalloprotease [Psychroserpens algicola]
MKKTILLFVALISCSVFNAQTEPECGTIMSPESQAIFNELLPQIQQYEQEYFQLANARRASTALTSVPIKAHIVRPSAGFGGLTIPQLNDAIATMNSYFANAYLEFFLCEGINYIDSDDYFNYTLDQEAALTNGNVDNVINIYFVNSITTSEGGGLCGYAYFPGGPETILMANGCTTNGSTLTHEMGHFFFLSHTHGNVNGSLTEELVDGSNCQTTGDFICDTAADPQLSNSKVNTSCEYIATEFDANGQLFNPNPRNIMSYSRQSCRNELSPQQYARIYATYQSSRAVMSCPSFSVEIDADYTVACSSTLDVNFTDNSIGATSWEWDVDGDDVIDYTTQNPNHTYTNGGAFDVTLTISDGTQSITKVFDNYIDFPRTDVSTSEINLSLTLDNFPQETSWEFRDSSGTVLYSSPTYVSGSDNFQTFSYDFDVAGSECYTFEIFDSANNGICCGFEGTIAYELTTLEGASILASDGVFTSTETTFIGNDVLSVDDYFISNQISLYPNPTNDVLHIQLSDTNNLPDSFTVYNVLGQIITTKMVTQPEDLSIQAKAFSGGVYYVKISKGTHSSTIPFIKN